MHGWGVHHHFHTFEKLAYLHQGAALPESVSISGVCGLSVSHWAIIDAQLQLLDSEQKYDTALIELAEAMDYHEEIDFSEHIIYYQIF